MNINDTLQYLNIGLPDDIARRKAWGDFEGAIRLIDLRLAQALGKLAVGGRAVVHRGERFLVAMAAGARDRLVDGGQRKRVGSGGSQPRYGRVFGGRFGGIPGVCGNRIPGTLDHNVGLGLLGVA